MTTKSTVAIANRGVAYESGENPCPRAYFETVKLKPQTVTQNSSIASAEGMRRRLTVKTLW